MSTAHAAARLKQSRNMKRTLFIGEYASKNVGDGIIKLAIEKLCRDHAVPADFKDFSGHGADIHPEQAAPIGYVSEKLTLKRRLLQSDSISYGVAALFFMTRYKRIAANYRPADYEQVVIGGGNLLMDNYLNFPLLILRIVEQCERSSTPVKLFAVGAGKRHSAPARKIVGRILGSPVVQSVICRDAHSYALVKAAGDAASSAKVKVGYDCGLYLDETDAPAPAKAKIGLGVIAPAVLKTVTPHHPMADATYALSWWKNVIASLDRHIGAQNLELFSNGSGPDNEFAYDIWERLRSDFPGLSVCVDIRTPNQLIEKISSYRAVTAYRMHAAVTAMALGVPVMGFEWDPKVLQMFTYCGKPQSCLPIDEFDGHSSEAIAARLMSETPAQLGSIRRTLNQDFYQTVCA